MKKNLELAVRILIYATFFVPLIVVPTSYIFPFIVPKILWFRTLVEIMLGAYLLLLIINYQEYKPRLTPLNVVLLLFLLSFGASTFFGVDWYHSFWDNHERMLGLFTIFHYVAFYYIANGVFKKWSDWQWALRVFLFAGSIVMFIGVLQTQNPDLLLNQGSERVASTLGNPIYVGGYGLFLAFVAYLLAVREKNKLFFWLEILLGILAVLGLFYSGTRGSMLGLLAGIMVVIIGYALVLKDKPKIRWTLAGLMGLTLLVLGFLYAYRTTDFVKNLPAVGRTLNTSLTDVEGSPRWIAWQIAIRSWKEKPVFGWGPNNFFYAFNQYYNPRSLNFGYGETWFDNAHNIILNTMAVQGTFGILVYLSVFATGILALIFAFRKKNINLHVVIVGSAFLVAHLVQNITVFENPTSYLYFMFWLAMINRLTSVRALSAEEEKISADKKVGYGAMGAIAVFGILAIFVFNIQPARANKMTLNTLRTLMQDPVLGVDSMKSVLSFSSPHIDDIRSDVARTVSQILTNDNITKLGKARATEIFDVVYPALQDNVRLHPLDIRNQMMLVQLSQLGAYLHGDGKYISDAYMYLESALKLSPKRQQIIYMIASFYPNVGKGGEAVKLLEGAINDNSSIAESYWRLALLYKSMNELGKAKEVIALAQKRNIRFDDQANNIIQQNILSVGAAKNNK